MGERPPVFEAVALWFDVGVPSLCLGSWFNCNGSYFGDGGVWSEELFEGLMEEGM